MGKVLKISFTTYQEYLEYRFNFILWRVRSFIFFLTLIFFWLAIYAGQNTFLNYSKDQMITYIIGSALLRSLVFGTRTGSIAGEIKEGTLSRLIIQPISPFLFWGARDIADKIINIGFALLEITAVILILDLTIYIPKNPINVVLFLLVSTSAILLYYFISLSLSFAAFWTQEVWATRWLFGYIFLEFFSGAIFPIDILPDVLQKIISYTPFPLLMFFPLKILLEQTSPQEILKGFALIIFWTVIAYLLARYLWKKGSKNYGAYGG